MGDSRSYRFHDGELTQITNDHSLAEEMVRTGELTTAEAAVHPHRHILTRALGIVSGWPSISGGSSRSAATGSCCAATA